MTLSRYVQIPYAYNGRSFDGCDCYGLLMLFFKEEFGIELLDYKHNSDTYDNLDQSVWLKNAHNEFEPVDIATPKLGDVVMTEHGGRFHCGICISHNLFLHTTMEAGCVVDKLGRWGRKIKGIYRHKGLI